jgi:hypothetical protein
MDDPTRRRWEKIADATIDRAFAAAMDDLKASQPTEASEIVRLDQDLANSHRLAVELFSGSGDEQGP